MPTTIELGNLLAAKRDEYQKKWDSYPTKNIGDEGNKKDIPANDLEGLKALQDEIDKLGKQFHTQYEAEGFAEKNAKRHDEARGIETHDQPDHEDRAYKGEARREHKGIGAGMLDAMKAMKVSDLGAALKSADGIVLKDFDLKTTMSTSAGWAPESVRSGRVVMTAQRGPQVIDAIPVVPINQAVSKYMRESTFTNNAAAVSEGGTMGEAALALTEITATVEKVGVYLPITDEQLDDVDGCAAYIENRITLMLAQKLDGYLLNGTGTTPQFYGYLQISGINTQAKGTDPIFDTVLKAFTKVRLSGSDAWGYADPTGIFLHPNDVQDIMLERTADGIYIMGNPGDSRTIQTLWGVRLTQTSVITEGTGLTGDFVGYSAYRPKQGLELKWALNDQDDFIKGKQKIRGTTRGVLDVYRNTSFCSLTGI
jgi:HK97 family phage major capsid protein